MEVKEQEKFSEITTPHFAPYYYVCFNILWLNDDEPYWWLDKENNTVTDILKNLEKSLDYFLMEG